MVLLKGESSAQFDALLQGFRDDFRPEGTAEEILVQKLATLTWRSLRTLDVESAEIEAEQRYGSRDADREKQQLEEALILYNSLERPGPGLLERCNNPLIFEDVCTFFYH